jgi:hypothetical protein
VIAIKFEIWGRVQAKEGVEMSNPITGTAEVSMLGIYASAICVVVSGYIATRYLQNASRLFTAMALLAFVWALAFVLWSTTDQLIRAMMGVYTSFLTVYIGGLLTAYAEERRQETLSVLAEPAHVHIFQLWSIPLLVFVVLGRTFYPFTKIHAAHFVEFSLGTIAFIALALGLNGVRGEQMSKAFCLFLVILVAYTIATALYLLRDFGDVEELKDIVRYVEVWWPQSNDVYCFAILKIVFTFVFGGMIAYTGMPDAKRKRGIWPHVRKIMN